MMVTLDAGIRSSLSTALPLQEAVVGALNIYAAQPGVFDPGAVEPALPALPPGKGCCSHAAVMPCDPPGRTGEIHSGMAARVHKIWRDQSAFWIVILPPSGLPSGTGTLTSRIPL